METEAHICPAMPSQCSLKDLRVSRKIRKRMNDGERERETETEKKKGERISIASLRQIFFQTFVPSEQVSLKPGLLS